jgi:hypothetical protein
MLFIFAKLRNSFRFRFASVSRNEIPLKTLVLACRQKAGFEPFADNWRIAQLRIFYNLYLYDWSVGK